MHVAGLILNDSSIFSFIALYSIFSFLYFILKIFLIKYNFRFILTLMDRSMK